MRPGIRLPNRKELLVQTRGPWSRRSMTDPTLHAVQKISSGSMDRQPRRSGFVPPKSEDCPIRFHVFRHNAPANAAWNQSAQVQVPSMPFRRPGGSKGGKRNRAVTANASIRSVGDLSTHRIYIEDVYPVVDGGRFPVKRIVGEEVEVWADIFRDGHVVLAA